MLSLVLVALATIFDVKFRDSMKKKIKIFIIFMIVIIFENYFKTICILEKKSSSELFVKFYFHSFFVLNMKIKTNKKKFSCLLLTFYSRCGLILSSFNDELSVNYFCFNLNELCCLFQQKH